MAEKTTPELPFELAKDTDGDTLRLTSPVSNDAPYMLRADDAETGECVQVEVDPAELMRNLAAFMPEVEPVAFLRSDGEVFRFDVGPNTAVMFGTGAERPMNAAEVGDGYPPLTPLYAHPPVTAEPAQSWKPSGDAWTQVRDAILIDSEGEEVMERAVADEACNRVFEDLAAAGYVVTAEPATAPSEPVWAMFGCESGEGFRCFNDGKRAYIEHDGVLWIQEHQSTAPSVTDASVDNSDATVRFDLVEGMNVEEWAHKADVATASNRNLMDVITAAREALMAHGFTSDTLESQTLAESIHALAGRGAPSVEQIAHVIAVHPTAVPNARMLAEEIHALYGTPGDAGDRDLLGIAEQQRDEANKRADRAVAEVIEWQQSRDRAEIARANAVAEVERCKAALEAAEAVIEALNYRFGSTVALQRARDDDDRAASMIRAAREKHRAARAAVEAETSEEADRG